MRAAAMLMKASSKFECEVTVACGAVCVNGKSLLGLMGLAAGKGMRVTLTTRGKDEIVAMTALEALFNDSFGEE